jgi:hypothetical protein
MIRTPALLTVLGVFLAGCPAAPPTGKTPEPGASAATKSAPDSAPPPWVGLWRTSIQEDGATAGFEVSLREDGEAFAGSLTVFTPTTGDVVQHSSCALLEVGRKGDALSFVAPIIAGGETSDALQFEIEFKAGNLEGRMGEKDGNPGSGRPVTFTRHAGKPARADGLTGPWRGSLTEHGVEVSFELTLKDVDGRISGSVTFTDNAPPHMKGKRLPLVEGKRMGRDLGFMVPISGKVDGDTLVFALTILATELRGETFEKKQKSKRLPVIVKRKPR